MGWGEVHVVGQRHVRGVGGDIERKGVEMSQCGGTQEAATYD